MDVKLLKLQSCEFWFKFHALGMSYNNLSFGGVFFDKHSILKVVNEELEQIVVTDAAKIRRY